MKLFQAMPCLLPACIALAVACGLAGCAVGEVVVGSTMRAANQIDAARTRSHGNNLLAKHLQKIKELQTKGDPLGDYLWVAANAEGWVDNPELDPEKLRDMYAAAAAKGSSDAKVALGMMYVTGQTSQQGMAGKRLDDSKLDLEKGLRLVEEGTRDRCWYWQALIMSLASENCLRPYRPAAMIWPKFRDGYPGVPQNQALMEHWRTKDDLCKENTAYIKTYSKCY